MSFTEHMKNPVTILGIVLSSVVIPGGTWVVNQLMEGQRQKGYMEGYEKNEVELRDARYELVITRAELEICRRSVCTK
jgi:hypothetical protein